MAVVSATRCNPWIRECYRRLKAAVKPFVILNAMMRAGTAWRADFTPLQVGR